MSPTASDCRINGAPSAVVDTQDRGLRYGDGVFETLAIVDGKAQLWSQHFERLQRGCERLGIPTPVESQLHSDYQALRLPQAGVLRITLTRGTGGQGYAPPISAQPTRIVQVLPAPQRPPHWWDEGVDVRDCQTQLARQPLLAGVKHLNRLEQVIARSEWDDPTIAEGLLCDTDGALIEATAANLIITQPSGWIIPEQPDSGVSGVMQAWIAEWAIEHGIHVEHERFARTSLGPEHGLILCNSLIGAWPVRRLNQIEHPIRPAVRDLQRAIYHKRLALTPEVMS